MKVKEMIEKLSKYNGEADFGVVVKGRLEPFEVCYGGSEGCTPSNCDHVTIMVNAENEATNEEVKEHA